MKTLVKGKIKLCMVPFHSYYIHSYYIHEERRGGEGVGENDHMGWASHKEGGGTKFYGEGGVKPSRHNEESFHVP